MAGDLLTKFGQYEPLRKNRFLFRFPSDLGIQEWWLASGSRPSIVQSDVEIPFLNTSRFILGRYTWEPIDVVLKDPIGPSATQAVIEWIRLGSESVTGRQGYKVGYARPVEIEMLDPTGVVVQKWLLVNTFITEQITAGNYFKLEGLGIFKTTLEADAFMDLCKDLGFPICKILTFSWTPGFDKSTVELLGEGKYANGKEREGVVVRSIYNSANGKPISFKVINLSYSD